MILKIAFVGVGSIANRHIVNLHALLLSRGMDHEIDVYRRGASAIDDPSVAGAVSHVYADTEVGQRDYDILFITNPTSMHYETLRHWCPHAKHMFIEKPVFDRLDCDIRALPLRADGVYYVACPLRYNAVLQYARQNIDMDRVFSARAICSSYLPEWRPGTDYRTCYSAHKDMGGGVAIDLVHEWDYLTWLMGFPQRVSYFGGTYSQLEIDSDDLAVYMAQYPRRIVELHLDYFGRKNQRTLQLFTAENVITLDLRAGTVSYEGDGLCRTLQLDAARNQFQTAELAHFLDIVQGRVPNDNTLENALRVLRLAQKGEV